MRMSLETIRTMGLVAFVGLLAGVGRADDGSPNRAEVAGIVVDQAGKPVADAEVAARSWEKTETTKTDSRGSFRASLPLTPDGRIYALIVAKAVGAIGVASVYGEGKQAELPKVVLKPARILQVRAIDREGRPVEGAEVYFLLDMRQVAAGQTDADGRWSEAVPSDSRSWSIYALKSRVGFDYASSERARGSTEAPAPLPERLTLSLDGARPPLRVKAVDQNAKPLRDVQVGPWLIRKPGRDVEMNGMTDALRRTDADGVAVFDWLPERMEGKLSIVSGSHDYYIPDHAEWLDVDKPVDEVAITFLPHERLSGRVTTADGRPASGVAVTAWGSGSGSNSYHGEAHTDQDGRYTLDVYSEQVYIIAAIKDDLAAPYKSGVVVRAGKPVQGVDLVLGPATRVKGRVTVGKDRTPAAAMNLSAVIDKGSIPKELAREGDRYHHGMTMYFWKTTDQDGRYEFILGPGEYRIQGIARVEPFKLTIPAENPPREIVLDFDMPRPKAGKLTVTVVDGDGRPAAGAVLDGAYQAMSSYFSPIRTNEQGTVQLVHSLDPLVLSASTPDRSQAAVVRLDAEATEARIVLKPTATASGRMVDPEGRPVAGRELTYGVRVNVSTKRGGPFGYHFGGRTTTDADGGFRLPGLVVGEKYEIQTEDDNRYVSAKTTPLAEGPGLLALGDVLLDLTPPKPYVPPTPAQVTAESFAARKEKSSRQKLEYALVEAKREYTRPAILFGKADDPACVDLFRLFDEPWTNDAETKDKPRPKTPADLRWSFELSSQEASQADVRSLASELGAPVGEGKPPVLLVLSDEGKAVASHPLTLGTDKKLDAPALAAFMLRHKPPTRDAEAMLAEGLARAKAQGKRVFLDFGASWCGPCRMLGRFLEANRGEMDRHYVFVKLDVSRDDHARSLSEKFQGKDASNGVPWYVILDADGNPLITSNAKDLGEDVFSTNIGFPSSKPGIDHFMTMLKQTAPKMSDETLAGLRAQLEKKP